MANLTGGSGAALMVTNPPVVGNLDFPYSNAALAPGTMLTTGDLAAGDTGEWGGLTECAVEFLVYVHPAGAVPISQSFVYGPLATASRQWGIQFDGSGALQFWVVRNDSVFVFANPSAVLVVDRWYHVVGTLLADNLYTVLDGVASAPVSFAGGSVKASAFTAGQADMVASGVGSSEIYIDEWATYRHGLTAARIGAHFDAARNRGFIAKQSGARILDVLNAVSSKAPRAIQAGARKVIPAYMSGQSPLEEIRKAVEADDVDAAFFAAADGTLTFLADGHRANAPYTTDKAVFGDAGGSELPYLNLEVDYSLTDLVNKWSGVRTAWGPPVPVTQTASDATSISNNFERPQALGDVPTWADSDVAAIVTRLVAKYKDALYRVTEIEPNMFDPNTAAAVMTLELMDRIRVRWTPPGGGSRIDQVVYVQHIQRTGTPGNPRCTLAVSPL